MLSLKIVLAGDGSSCSFFWDRRGGKDHPPSLHVQGPCSCCHHKVSSLVRGSCSINISGSSVGVPRVSWGGSLVQDEEASDRQQRRREKNAMKTKQKLPKPQGQG